MLHVTRTLSVLWKWLVMLGGLTVDEVKSMLGDIRVEYGADADYQRLRGRLPKGFA